jgi:hypothetical protein
MTPRAFSLISIPFPTYSPAAPPSPTYPSASIHETHATAYSVINPSLYPKTLPTPTYCFEIPAGDFEAIRCVKINPKY